MIYGMGMAERERELTDIGAMILLVAHLHVPIAVFRVAMRVGMSYDMSIVPSILIARSLLFLMGSKGNCAFNPSHWRGSKGIHLHQQFCITQGLENNC